MPFEHGPFVTVAALCDQVLQEKDGVISLIRIVDKVTSTDVDTATPDQMPPMLVSLTMVVQLRSGAEGGGRHTLTLRPVDPTGAMVAQTELPVEFAEAPSAAVTMLVKVGLMLKLTGLHWIDVLLDGELLTRSPLEVLYQPLTPGLPGPTPG
jgi:hypothetical protein